jgi:lysylphosphatidylglycerol synthetase-like protein (DUF2156 family)
MSTTASAPPKQSTQEGVNEPRALTLLRRHSDHPSAFLTINQQTLHYQCPGVEGLIAYRPEAGHLIQLCGPIAAPDQRELLLRSFLDWAHRDGKRVVAVQVPRADIELYRDSGFCVNQFGSSFSIDLEPFTLKGTRFFKLRNKIRRAEREGVTVQEYGPQELQDPQVQAALDDLDARWLRAKGRHVKELTFMIGERGGRGAPYRRALLARQDRRLVGYVTYSPCFGEQPGWLYDLTRRAPDAPPGTVELMFRTGLEALRDEGCRWLHLGLTPFVGLAPENELDYGSSRIVGLAGRELARRGEAIYPARAQETFKLKWAPPVIVPEYVAFEPGPTLAGVWRLLRISRSI